jgi:hypothetical protein
VPTATKAVVAPPHSLDEFLAKTDDSHLRPLTGEALEVKLRRLRQPDRF